MRFTKIKVGKEATELAWTFVDENGATLSTQLTHADKPAPELIDALQAFKVFALDLISAPDGWTDDARVTTLSLNEEKEGKTRGLIVTCVRPVAKASGRLLVLNTPHMREEGENTTAGATGVYGPDIVDMITAAEKAAQAYVKGDRAQAEIFPTDSSNPKKAADAPVDQVGARRKKRDRAAGTPGETMNPGKTVPMDDGQLRAALLTVDRDVPIDAIARWTSTERDKVQRFVEAKIALKDGSRVVHIDELVEPDTILLSATPPLGGDGWTDPNAPAKLTDEAVVEITGAIEKAD